MSAQKGGKKMTQSEKKTLVTNTTIVTLVEK